jgi:hypothetical protein
MLPCRADHITILLTNRTPGASGRLALLPCGMIVTPSVARRLGSGFSAVNGGSPNSPGSRAELLQHSPYFEDFFRIDPYTPLTCNNRPIDLIDSVRRNSLFSDRPLGPLNVAIQSRLSHRRRFHGAPGASDRLILLALAIVVTPSALRRLGSVLSIAVGH